MRYYGVDLHYLRLRREYELLGNAYLEEEAMSFYEKEAWLIAHSDVVYYPSTGGNADRGKGISSDKCKTVDDQYL